MTTKVLAGTYSAGYTIASGVTTLRLTSTGYVAGSGIATPYGATTAYSIVNRGRIFETYSTPHLLRDDGVYLGQGGSVTNGGRNDTQARIEGYRGVFIGSAPGTVRNFGAIIGDYRSGVDLYSSVSGGLVVNGSVDDTGALIEGGAYSVGVGVSAGARVRNFASISGEVGVEGLANGISLTNGALDDKSALITGEGGSGLLLFYDERVRNFATISGVDAVGIDSGVVTNGSALDTAALISGTYYGVSSVTGKLTNFGTVSAQPGIGIKFVGRAVLVNGSPDDASALIVGGTGIYLANLSASAGRDSLVNYGTIEGAGGLGQAGVSVEAGTTATVTNFGLISGAGGVAVDFNSSADVLIVEAGCAFEGSVTGDGGTLELASGTGVIGLHPADGRITVSGDIAPTTFQDFDALRIDAGASFSSSGTVAIAGGQVINDAGWLVLGSYRKTGILNAGLIEASAGGAITVNGTLVNTGTLLASGGALTVAAAVSGGGVLMASAGTLSLDGQVSDLERAVVAGGTLDFNTVFEGSVTFTRAGGQLGLAQSQLYHAAISGFSHTGGSSLDLGDIAFVNGEQATYTPFGDGFGLLTVTDGTHTANLYLLGDYRHSTFTTSSDGHGGVTVKTSQTPTIVTAHLFIAAMATLGDGAGTPLHHAEAPGIPGAPLLAPNRHAIVA
jgi:hypothetical protein